MSCHQIDDYLDGDLAELDRTGFEQHLANCPICAAVVEQQRQLAGLLEAATQHFDRPSPELVRKIVRRLRMKRRRRVFAYAAALSAAAAVVWVLLSRLPIKDKSIEADVKPALEIAEAKTAGPPVRISFANESSLVIVPEETGSPNVTFVWVFPNQNKTH